jgi:hypothetical protein
VLITLQDIEIELLLADAEGGQSVLATFHEILEVIFFTNQSVNQLDFWLEPLEPLLPIAEAFDCIDKDTWQRWSITIPKVRGIVNSLTSILSIEKRKSPISEYSASLEHALNQEFGSSMTGFTPLKAILLIGHFRRHYSRKYRDNSNFRTYDFPHLTELENVICGCARSPKHRQSDIVKEYLPEWINSMPPSLWRDTFLDISSRSPATFGYEFIHAARKILLYKDEFESHNPLSQPATQNDSLRISTGLTYVDSKLISSIGTEGPTNLNKKTIAIFDIVKMIRGTNPTEFDRRTVGTFREILMVISFGDFPADQLDIALKSIEQLMPIVKELSPIYTETWEQWTTTILKVRGLLNNIFPNAIQDKWRGQLKDSPLISCITSEIKANAPTGLLPAKAIVLIRFYAKLVKNPSELENSKFQIFHVFNAENNLADTIRKCCTLKWKHRELAQEYLPSWPSDSPEKWIESFIKNSKRMPKYYPDPHRPRSYNLDFIHTILETLNFTSSKSDNMASRGAAHLFESGKSQFTTQPNKNVDVIEAKVTSDTDAATLDVVAIKQINSVSLQQIPYRPTEELASPPTTKSFSVTTRPSHERISRSGKSQSVRPSLNLFQKLPSYEDADSDSIAPELQTVEPVQDTPADQPNQLAVIQSLEVRYTNYRTAMDNQRLPWSWDCLNIFEVAALTQALKESADVQDSSVLEKQGAFFVWLLLVTGQSIDQLLKFGLTHAIDLQGALLCGPIYRRFISSPPHAFQPNEQEKVLLRHHAEFIDLQLVPPFPLICRELGLIDPKIKPINHYQNIGTYLKLDVSGAESAIRQFLEQHRTRGLRLLPGRIRNVLNAELMKVSHDPVATHLLSSLPSDMPPAGVYYTSYSEDALQRIYDQATARIFGKQS